MSNLPAAGDPTLAQLEDRIAEGVVAAGEALDEIHARRLYLPAFASFDDYCRERWGITKRTAFRKIEQAAATRALPPGAPVPSQRELARERQPETLTYPKRDARAPSSNAPDAISRTVTDRPLDTISPDAVLPASAPQEAAMNGSSAVGAPAPASTPPRPAERPITDAEGLRWLGSKTDAQVRAQGDPYGSAIRGEIARWATAFGFDRQDVVAITGATKARRAGTITRPADRTPPPSNGACIHPKDREQNKGYGIFCGLCLTRLR